jgi:hypothetical protein
MSEIAESTKNRVDQTAIPDETAAQALRSGAVAWRIVTFEWLVLEVPPPSM